jgi:hypothetical protein
MESTGRPQFTGSRFTGSNVRQAQHVCAFFNDVGEQHRVLRPYIEDGLTAGDKIYNYVDPDRWDEHLEWLTEAGVDLPEATSTGQVEVRRWEDSTLVGEHFDLDTWLASFEQVLRSGAAGGYAQTRVLGHMEWALVDLPGVDDLIEYETRVNDVIPKYEGMVICAYDVSKFGAGVVVDALRTHPALIIGGMLQENPFYVSPDQFLIEVRERRSGRKTISSAG